MRVYLTVSKKKLMQALLQLGYSLGKKGRNQINKHNANPQAQSKQLH